jgi:hypothetical protein
MAFTEMFFKLLDSLMPRKKKDNNKNNKMIKYSTANPGEGKTELSRVGDMKGEEFQSVDK